VREGAVLSPTVATKVASTGSVMLSVAVQVTCVTSKGQWVAW
jgi:hypothetical protein